MDDASDSTGDNAKVSFPPPFVYLGFLLIGLGVEGVTGRLSFGMDRFAVWLAGGLLLVAGLALNMAATGRFRRAGTPVPPWRSVKGIVDGGVYRFTRNPMYLGMATAYAGLAIAFDGPVALALLPVVLVVIRTQVIAREERYLEAKFGDTYRDYKRRVRRWL